MLQPFVHAAHYSCLCLFVVGGPQRSFFYFYFKKLFWEKYIFFTTSALITRHKADKLCSKSHRSVTAAHFGATRSFCSALILTWVALPQITHCRFLAHQKGRMFLVLTASSSLCSSSTTFLRAHYKKMVQTVQTTI